MEKEKNKEELFDEEKIEEPSDEKTKEVVPQESPAGLPAETDRAPGTEGITSEDIALPRFRLIQATSLEAEEGTTKPGIVKHSITEEEFESVEVVLITLSKNRVMFDPENRRGGPVCRSFDMKTGTGCECGCGNNCLACEYSKGFQSQCSKIYTYPCIAVNNIGTELIPTLLSFMKSSAPVSQKINASVIGKIPAQPFWNYVWEIGTVKKDYKKRRSAFVYTAKVKRETTEDERKWAKMAYETFFKDAAQAEKRMAVEFEEEEQL